MAKKEFLKSSLVKMVLLLKHRDRTPGQEELPQDHEERLAISVELGKVKSRGSFQ